MKQRFIIFAFLFLIILSISNEAKFYANKLNVGFFSPSGVDEFIYNVDFSMMNAYLYNDPETGQLVINLNQLRPNVEALRGLKHKLNIDLGPVICDIRYSEKLNRTCTTEDGRTRTKAFEPLFPNKLRNIVSDKEIENRMKGFVKFVKEYRDNIGILFLADEPYLNGISRHELERAIRKIRSMFVVEGVQDIQLGTIFAGGMFDAEFAEHIQKTMAKYVTQIDNHYYKNKHLLNEQSSEARNFQGWVDTIQKRRLTTYDTCGNIFTKGGIPKGLNIVAFDFYLSTLLLDIIHDSTLKYYAEHYNNKSCDYFKNKTAYDIRKELSFFGDESHKMTKKQYEKDHKILDMAFDCRMQATLKLLQIEIPRTGNKDLKIMLIGESSANGVLEFNSEGKPKRDQPMEIIEQRMLDEVKRTFNFYTKNKDIFKGGLMFFVYPDSYDYSINLSISGAKSAKRVTSYIYTKRNPSYKKLKRKNHAPILTSIGTMVDYQSILNENEAADLAGIWYILKDPIIAFDPDGDDVILNVKSSNNSLVEAKITSDRHLALKYKQGYGEVVITVIAEDDKGLSNKKSFRIMITSLRQYK